MSTPRILPGAFCRAGGCRLFAACVLAVVHVLGFSGIGSAGPPAEAPSAAFQEELARKLDASAIRSARRLLRGQGLDPARLPPVLRFGYALALGRLSSAAGEEELLRSLMADGSDPDLPVRVRLAEVLEAREAWPEALEILEELDRLDGARPMRIATTVLRLRLLRRLGRPKEVLGFLEEVEELMWKGLDRAEALSHKVWAAKALGREEIRARALEQLLSRHPNSVQARDALRGLPLRTRLLHLVKHYPRGLGSQKALGRVLGWNSLASAAERQGAVDAFLLARGTCALRAGAYERAGELFAEALVRTEQPEVAALALWGRARSLRRRDLDLDAAAAYRLLARRYPGDSRAGKALVQGAGLAQLHGEDALARLDLERLVADHQQSPEAVRALWTLALLDLRSGRSDRAAEQLEVLGREHADAFGWSRGRMGAQALYWLGRAFGKLGRKAEARATWAVIVEKHAPSYYALLAYSRLRSEPPVTTELQGPALGLDHRFGQRRPASVHAADQRPRIARGSAPPASSLQPPALASDADGRNDDQRPVLASHLPPSSSSLPLEPRPEIRAALALEGAGLRNLARSELRRLLRANRLSPVEVDLLAALHLEAGNPTLCYLTERYAGRFDAPPRPGNLARWQLAYPRPYRQLVERSAAAEGLDPHLVWAVMRQESAYLPRARSPAGAMGLLQLLPVTARAMAREIRGLSLKRDSQIFEPETNLRLGCRFLAQLLSRYRSRLPLALAAYNAGPRYADRWLERWSDLEMDLLIEKIPIRRTMGYTKQVLQSYATYRYLYGPREGKQAAMLVLALEPPGSDAEQP